MCVKSKAQNKHMLNQMTFNGYERIRIENYKEYCIEQ